MTLKGGATARRLGGGGREPFEVDSFHAPPIGIMLNAVKFAGDRSPPPPVPPPMMTLLHTGYLCQSEHTLVGYHNLTHPPIQLAGICYSRRFCFSQHNGSLGAAPRLAQLVFTVYPPPSSEKTMGCGLFNTAYPVLFPPDTTQPSILC